MKVQEGDVLVCQCDNCDVELTVTKSCEQGECSTCSDIQVKCCDVDMSKKPR
jgi:hypothetical protein